jgi:hypothetical protein
MFDERGRSFSQAADQTVLIRAQRIHRSCDFGQFAWDLIRNHGGHQMDEL